MQKGLRKGYSFFSITFLLLPCLPNVGGIYMSGASDISLAQWLFLMARMRLNAINIDWAKSALGLYVD